jgi:tricorn protease
LLAIDGQPVSASERAFRALAGKAGTAVELTVNSVPRNEGARMVKMTAVSRARHSDLLYEQWVQRNRVAVERASTGRLAYLHLREMDPAALARFRRELLTEADGKEALVLDVRNNGGGRIHDELFALLAPRVHSYETPRGGLRMTQPFGAVSRPMILLINGGSFSDAEIFPNGFRALGLGKLVGVPTGGGVIGTRDEVLLDNQTRFRVPETGWETVEGRNLENWGVPPDFLVEITPADFLAGRDPQLERATLELLKELNAKKTGRR